VTASSEKEGQEKKRSGNEKTEERRWKQLGGWERTPGGPRERRRKTGEKGSLTTLRRRKPRAEGQQQYKGGVTKTRSQGPPAENRELIAGERNYRDRAGLIPNPTQKRDRETGKNKKAWDCARLRIAFPGAL